MAIISLVKGESRTEKSLCEVSTSWDFMLGMFALQRERMHNLKVFSPRSAYDLELVKSPLVICACS
jgi:hypothetical protein